MDLWKPINFLVEAANQNKEAWRPRRMKLKHSKPALRSMVINQKLSVKKSNSTSSPSGSVKPRRAASHATKKRRGLIIPARGLLLMQNSKCDRRFSLIWFGRNCALATDIFLLLEGDGSVHVSTYKEVSCQEDGSCLWRLRLEILLLGQPVASMLQLHKLGRLVVSRQLQLLKGIQNNRRAVQLKIL
ncbi:hypothetical protein NC652_021730 [Populus alba x Populus x berolinensis]|nr:hypothetical protein NC652_021730 [Populus alba x Populus x berolinensis]